MIIVGNFDDKYIIGNSPSAKLWVNHVFYIKEHKGSPAKLQTKLGRKG
jgi:hypothetical protein